MQHLKVKSAINIIFFCNFIAQIIAKMNPNTENNNFQDIFFNHLKQVVPNDIALVDEIAQLLSISNDSAYRRMRGKTDLTLTETYILAAHYKISVDSLFSSKGNTVSCNYIKMTSNTVDFEAYLKYLLQQLIQVNKDPDVKFIYAAEEIPIFRSFHSAKLSAFKLFYWQRSVLNIADLQTKKFDWDIISAEQLQLANQLHESYMQVPTIEIWTSETIQTNIKQIEYYFESGAFQNKADAITCLQELKDMVTLMNTQAERESKDSLLQVPYKLYNSELIIGTNCIFIEAFGNYSSHISFNTFNSLAINNKEFCDEVDNWMRNLIKKSTLISGTAEKQRFKFFNSNYKAIDACIERINNY